MLFQLKVPDENVKVTTGIRPMAPVLNRGTLEVSEHEMLIFSIRKKIIDNDNSLVLIILSKVGENEFLQIL